MEKDSIDSIDDTELSKLYDFIADNYDMINDILNFDQIIDSRSSLFIKLYSENNDLRTLYTKYMTVMFFMYKMFIA